MAGGAGGLQGLKKRIKSIKSTRQVTKAMEAVSASKMRKAVAKALASRDYAGLGWEVVQGLAHSSDVAEHPLFVKRPVKSSLLVIYTSDRGLCGAMNAQLIRQVSKWIKAKQEAGVKLRVISIGKKGQHAITRLGLPLEQSYVSLGDKPTSVILRPIASTAMDFFQTSTVDEVVVAFTDFKSSLVQVPVIKTLLPFSAAISQTSGDAESAGAGSGERANSGASNTLLRASRPAPSPATTTSNLSEYVFEPGKESILNTLIPRLVEIQVYQALLESVASEHSSRMLAMRNATDAASDMISNLTLTYNQARQAGITQEIAEISAGRLALEN